MDVSQKVNVIFMRNGISYLPVQRVIVAVLVRRLSPKWYLHYKPLKGKVNCVIIHLNRVPKILYRPASHFHPPVIRPPTKAKPREEAKAAACMEAFPLNGKRGTYRNEQYMCVCVCVCAAADWCSITLLSFQKPQLQYRPAHPGCQACHADCGLHRCPGFPGWMPGWASHKKEGKYAI